MMENSSKLLTFSIYSCLLIILNCTPDSTQPDQQLPVPTASSTQISTEDSKKNVLVCQQQETDEFNTSHANGPLSNYVLESQQEKEFRVQQVVTKNAYPKGFLSTRPEESIDHRLSYAPSGNSVQVGIARTWKDYGDIDELENRIQSITYSINSLESYEKFEKLIYETFDKITCDVLVKIDEYYEESKKSISTSCSEISTRIIKLGDKMRLAMETVLVSNFFKNLEKDAQLDLVNSFYYLNFQIAGIHLCKILVLPEGEIIEIGKHIQGYQFHKSQLKNRYTDEYKTAEKNLAQPHLASLAEYHEFVEKFSRSFYIHFNPLSSQYTIQSAKGFKPRNKARITKIKSQNYELFLQKHAEQPEDPSAEVRFFEKWRAVFREVIINSTDAAMLTTEAWQKTCAQFTELEVEGCKLIVPLVKDKKVGPLGVDDLLQLYEGMYRIAPKSDIYDCIKWHVMVYIQAKKWEEAKVRLKAMELFYSHNRPESKEQFDLFQASAYALCGDYSRLNMLHQHMIQEEIRRRKKKEQRHQRKIEKIKEALKVVEKPIEATVPFLLPSTKAELITHKTEPRDLLSEAMLSEHEQAQRENSEAKIERHAAVELNRQQKSDKHVAKEPLLSNLTKVVSKKEKQGTVSPEDQSEINFLLPKKAYKTISKIFDDQWKIARADIENLFEQLGNSIDTKTKSSHHIIKLPQGIALIQGDKIVAAVTNLSIDMGGHLSLPDWAEQVPVYMRPQILGILNKIGIKQDNYSKGNGIVYQPLETDVASQAETDVTWDDQ